MDRLDARLLNEFQRGFPLVDRPFAEIAHRLETSEHEVLARYARLIESGSISRIGVVFAPHAVGVSTLAAIAAPAERVDEIAAIIDAQPETNHNYEREHRFNLWFVLTAPAQLALDAALARIERAVGLPVLALTLLEEYHIDLGFDLSTRGAKTLRREATVRPARSLCAQERRLLAAVQDGLAVQPHPFAEVARIAGCSTENVRTTLASWLADGVARRIGVVVRHRALGYSANAMVVWDVPDSELPQMAQFLAGHPDVTLCYRRPRRRPDWPYNLFCMIHGRDRATVLSTLAQLRHCPRAAGIPYDVLFSTRCFKQRGARYAQAA